MVGEHLSAHKKKGPVEPQKNQTLTLEVRRVIPSLSKEIIL